MRLFMQLLRQIAKVTTTDQISRIDFCFKYFFSGYHITMKKLSLSFACLFLLGCSKSGLDRKLSKPFIAQLHSVELVFGKPYNDTLTYGDHPSILNDDEILITNGCGRAFARLDDLLTEDIEKFETSHGIGEWCRNPFHGLSTKQFLYIPDTLKSFKFWNQGKTGFWTGSYYRIYNTDYGIFADPVELMNGTADLNELNQTLSQNNLPQIYTLPKPQYIDWVTLETADDFQKNGTKSERIYDLRKDEDGFEVYLVRGIPLDKDFPKLSETLDQD